MNMNMPVITLANGLRVGNLSSPHPFRFTSGEELPAVSRERTGALNLDVKEVVHPRATHTDIELVFVLTAAVAAALDAADADQGVDIVIVPLPVMTALKAAGRSIGKARVCRVADRVSKEIHPDVFCI
jgi:hypothetical protein